MKFPVTATREHQGKTLSIDCDQETLSLFDDTGQRLSILTWGTLIEHMLSVDASPIAVRIPERPSQSRYTAPPAMENTSTV